MFCGTAALAAITITELGWHWQLLSGVVIGSCVIRQLLRYRRVVWRITHNEQGSDWQLAARLNQHSPLVSLRHPPVGLAVSPQLLNTSLAVSGTLLHAGYRSASLLILVFRSQSSAVHRLPVWRDQLNAQQFSYLHHQLLFASV